MGFHYVYPSPEEVKSYWDKAVSEVPLDTDPVETLECVFQPEDAHDRHAVCGIWLKFRGVDGVPFWCIWQKCPKPGVHKTLIHLPGYGTEVSSHPYLVYSGYHVIHINPRGYCAPNGLGNWEWRENDGTATVLYRNLDKPDEYGYRFWFQDAIMAFRWLQRQPNIDKRFGFFGSSQGGGSALILASILSDEDIVGAASADVPFLTNFPLNFTKVNRGAYEIAFSHMSKEEEAFQRSFHTLGFVDTIKHAPRMRFPVLLTVGDIDEACPSNSIHSLYDLLPHTRAIVEFHGQAHGYTPCFLPLTRTWFNLHL